MIVGISPDHAIIRLNGYGHTLCMDDSVLVENDNSR